ncbi:MAG: hypothetical protein J6Q30_07545 [Oscillospiraceae bacterium]|nr:hypothetical protein [Oscillospiraceae bacterium]
MNYENKDRELNLKALCFCVARKWKRMLVVAVALALALGGYRGWKGMSAVTDPQVLAQQQAVYEENYAKYQAQVTALNTKISQVQEDIRNHGVYMEESVLMGIDYRNTWTVSVDLYIETQENTSVSGAGEGYTKADVIADAYRNMMVSNRVLEKAGESVDIAPQYLSELISIPLPVYHEYQEGPLVTVLIRSGDAESAQKILDALLDCLDTIQTEITDTMGKHTLSTVNTGVTAMVDEELADLQEAAADRLLVYTNYLEEYRYALGLLSAPSMPVLSTGGAVKSAVKYAVVGFLGGAFLVAAVACVSFAIGDKVYSAEELKSRFGVTVLGKVSLNNKKRCCIDRLLDRLEDRGKTEKQGALAVMGANVANHCPENATLLVAGTAGEAGMEKIVEALTRALPGASVISGGSLLESLPAIEGLSKCDAVLLVERCSLSRYSQIGAQLEAVDGINKKLLGCVVLEK